jgi:hypothetical protein
MLNFSTQELPFALSEKLVNWLSSLVEQDGVTTINIRDSSYSADNGGFRPVEICVEKKGDKAFLHYLTEFTFAGLGIYAELVKSNDFDFSNDRFEIEFFGLTAQCLGHECEEHFTLLTKNLVEYVNEEYLDTVKTSHSKAYLAL